MYGSVPPVSYAAKFTYCPVSTSVFDAEIVGIDKSGFTSMVFDIELKTNGYEVPVSVAITLNVWAP